MIQNERLRDAINFGISWYLTFSGVIWCLLVILAIKCLQLLLGWFLLEDGNGPL